MHFFVLYRKEFEGKKKEEAVTSSFDNLKCPQYKGNIMIILNSNKINTKLDKNYNLNEIVYEEVLNKYENIINYGYLECPNCKSSDHIKWGYYERNVIYIKDNSLQARIIKIKRIKCNGCNHTHALMPDGIIPYKQHTLKTIIDVIVNDNKLNINEDLVLKWKKQIKKIFIPLLRTTFIEKIPYKLNDIVKIEFDRKDFLKSNKRYFLQIKILDITYAQA